MSIVTLLFPILIVQSQETADQSPPVQFRLITMADIASFFYDNDGEKERIYATPGNFSPLYTAPEGRKIEFYNELAGPTSNDPVSRVAVIKVKLPAGEGPFLIVLKAHESPGSSFNSYVIDHSLEAHPPDTFRTFNFSKRSMAVRLADKDTLLSTGESDTVPYPEGGKAWLKVAAKDRDDGWLKVKSMPYTVGSDSRTTILLMDIPPSKRDPSPRGIAVRKIRERVYKDEAGGLCVR